ncbi:MAG: fructosamine kinase family protein, partial [Planctomycetota bacterium]
MRFDPANEILRKFLRHDEDVVSVSPVSGGCISRAFHLRVKNGDDQIRDLFVKTNHSEFESNFRAESDGLQAIHAAGVIRVPEPIGLSKTAETVALAMEWIEPSTPTPHYHSDFGTRLATLHRVTSKDDDAHGWSSDNFLGASPQLNSPA